MTNCILITSGSRPRLLEQTLRTLYKHTPPDEFNLTMVCDGPLEERYVDDRGPLQQYGLSVTGWENRNYSQVSVDPACHIIGRFKNLGAYWSEKQFGRGEWLCFLDDDMALFPYWLEKMIKRFGYDLAEGRRLCLLGGARHPFHGVNERHVEPQAFLNRPKFTPDEWRVIHPELELTDAVAGYCHFMKWPTWDHFGPYDANSKGTGQSEDYAFSRKIVDAGGKVGYIHPSVMAHTGITNSEGKPILGGELIERAPRVLYE